MFFLLFLSVPLILVLSLYLNYFPSVPPFLTCFQSFNYILLLPSLPFFLSLPFSFTHLSLSFPLTFPINLISLEYNPIILMSSVMTNLLHIPVFSSNSVSVFEFFLFSLIHYRFFFPCICPSFHFPGLYLHPIHSSCFQPSSLQSSHFQASSVQLLQSQSFLAI